MYKSARLYMIQHDLSNQIVSHPVLNFKFGVFLDSKQGMTQWHKNIKLQNHLRTRASGIT